MNAVEQFYHAFIPAIVLPVQLVWGIVSTNPVLGALMVLGLAAQGTTR
ncbi:MAG: hypothetical protein WCK70_03495 [Chloroflexales bacterium]